MSSYWFILIKIAVYVAETFLQGWVGGPTPNPPPSSSGLGIDIGGVMDGLELDDGLERWIGGS